MRFKDVINKLNDYNLLLSYDHCDLVIKNITYSSKEVEKNFLLFCKGKNFRKEYLEEGISLGINCYVSEIDYNVSIPKIIVKDIRKSMAIISNMFYPDNLYKIGITGTKGKTTTNYFIHNILKEYLGYKPGIVATHYFYTGKSEGKNHLTTPESLDLHKYLNEMDSENLKYMSMEASSQAVFHNRIFDINFDIGCFLNISPDHISEDEHNSFEEYLDCKLSFLKQCDKVIVFNGTDYFDKVISSVSNKEVITFGFSDADYIISDIKNEDGYSFVITNNGESKQYRINMLGRFNVINAACAVVVSDIIGIPYEKIKKGLLDTHVKGRMNFISGGKCLVIVDYAHNGLSAESIYKSVKEDYPDKRIISVFGCPDSRGENRRKGMGEMAGRYADYVYLTADDPGYSTAVSISEDIAKHIEKYHHNYEIVEDRKEAIEKALKEATKDDIILLLGKGDEAFQMIEGKEIPYESDEVVVKNYFKSEDDK